MKKINFDNNLNVIVQRDFLFNVCSKSVGVHKLVNLLLAQAETGDAKIHSYICDAYELVDFLRLAGKDKIRAVERLIKESKEAYFQDGDFQHAVFEVAEHSQDNSVVLKLSDFVFEYLPTFMGTVIKF